MELVNYNQRSPYLISIYVLVSFLLESFFDERSSCDRSSSFCVGIPCRSPGRHTWRAICAHCVLPCVGSGLSLCWKPCHTLDNCSLGATKTKITILKLISWTFLNHKIMTFGFVLSELPNKNVQKCQKLKKISNIGANRFLKHKMMPFQTP